MRLYIFFLWMRKRSKNEVRTLTQHALSGSRAFQNFHKTIINTAKTKTIRFMKTSICIKIVFITKKKSSLL